MSFPLYPSFWTFRSVLLHCKLDSRISPLFIWCLIRHAAQLHARRVRALTMVLTCSFCTLSWGGYIANANVHILMHICFCSCDHPIKFRNVDSADSLSWSFFSFELDCTWSTACKIALLLASLALPASVLYDYDYVVAALNAVVRFCPDAFSVHPAYMSSHTHRNCLMWPDFLAVSVG